jgi:hypothetical protein
MDPASGPVRCNGITGYSGQRGSSGTAECVSRWGEGIGASWVGAHWVGAYWAGAYWVGADAVIEPCR